MRLVLEDALSEEDIKTLLPRGIEKMQARPTRHYTTGGDFDFQSNPVIKRISQKIARHVPVKLRSPSKWYVECRPDGHGPHYDGCRPRPEDGAALGPNHMSWCQYSAVSLLTDPASFSGGEFSFHDPDEVHKDDLRGSLVIYSSGITNDPQKHSAAPHEAGIRMMLLMFFATE